MAVRYCNNEGSITQVWDIQRFFHNLYSKYAAII